MNHLIVYASKHGTVKKAADILRFQLKGSCELHNILEEESVYLSDVDTVIIGASVYFGSIHKKLKQFLENYEEVLLQKRVAIFICAGEENPESLQKEIEDNFPLSFRNHAHPIEVIGYEIHFNQLNFIEKFIIKNVKNIQEDKEKLCEFAIFQFARALNM
ncbi:hypothetical protein Q73_08875 [Bacillus coahuilensis m2-6]|uniref:Flavodoxin domain-containing protein n=1 Tax=Bacillus coahuilensis p1.1.43 TaxID=1150625 RepID=A0A147K7S3_9BACI|nr:flavodoxin domain-containing protein [Bacillus coahuilensis]KUP06138.1 hypothetical protein Q75_09370 [Bacillus coahuilensis p1.1.43]KUP07483.1 hypothetical protein Q73_08875 [Bacillus coahuilensis m2-6]